jgi:hypothetical protein
VAVYKVGKGTIDMRNLTEPHGIGTRDFFLSKAALSAALERVVQENSDTEKHE